MGTMRFMGLSFKVDPGSDRMAASSTRNPIQVFGPSLNRYEIALRPAAGRRRDC
jgi:hypothetical protein